MNKVETSLLISAPFILIIALNLALSAVEGAAALLISSNSLLSDAIHNVGDVAGVIIAMIGYRLGKMVVSKHKTFGYKRAESIAVLLNGVFLIVGALFTLGKSIYDGIFHSYQNIQPEIVLIISCIGIVLNLLITLLLLKSGDVKNNQNIRMAFWHSLSDVMFSVMTAVGGVVMMLTGAKYIDILLGIILSFIILHIGWKELKENVHQMLLGVPRHIDLDQVRQDILTMDGVAGVHHMHIWVLHEDINHLEGHIVINNIEQMEKIKQAAKTMLKTKHGIGHTTLEIELSGHKCADELCTSVSYNAAE